jgi:hypothetical protein
MINDTITIDDIFISDFIFHIVHHGGDEAILMDSTPLGDFEEFFKKRILEILHGNKFNFLDDSIFKNALLSLGTDESNENFVSISKSLAKDLHSRQDNRIKAGVMILIKAVIQERRKGILIKYDNENVLTYSQEGRRAILREISNTFSKSKDALQKSAIVDLDDINPFVLVIDKTEKKNITHFFKGFLGVFRRYDNKILTERVRDSYLATVKKHKESLPSDYASTISEKYYEFVQNNEVFEKESFLNSIFGPHFHPEMLATFNKELKSRDILGEEFEFDKTMSRPRQRKFRTKEGVIIQFSDNAADTININTYNAERTIITIETTQLIEENVPSSSSNITN